MTDSPIYDGSGKLSLAIAELCGLSPKSQSQIAGLIKQAKDALGITTKSKRLPDAVKLKIWQWHFDRLQAVKTISQATDSESVNIVSQPATVLPVEIISQSTSNEAVELFTQTDSDTAVNINSHYDINALVRIAFYTTSKGAKTRQVIALEEVMVYALTLATGITKQDVPKWVQAAVDNWGAFDPELPITRQVKFLIIRELTTQLERLKNT